MDKIVQYWEYFLDWLANGKYARPIFGGIAVVVILVILLIVIITASLLGLGNTNSNIPKIDTDKQGLIDKKSFDDVTRLEKVSQVSLGNTQSMLVEESTQVFLDTNDKINYNNQAVTSSPEFLPYTIYKYGDKIILNEEAKTTIFNTKDKSFRTLDIELQLTPQDKQIQYLQKNGDLYQVKFANDIDKLKEATTFDNVKPILKPSMVESRTINGKNYLLMWQNSNRTGNLEIWIKNEKNYELVNTYPSIVGVKITTKGIVYTKDIGSNKTSLEVIIFDKDKYGESFSPKIEDKLRAKDINGGVSPRRCTIDQNAKLICLIKQLNIEETDDRFKDEIVEIDYRGNNVGLAYQGIKISGASLYNNGVSTYLISQGETILYKIK